MVYTFIPQVSPPPTQVPQFQVYTDEQVAASPDGRADHFCGRRCSLRNSPRLQVVESLKRGPVESKRSLRGTDDEERGATELAKKLKAWASKTNLGREVREWARKRSEAKAVNHLRLAKVLADNDADFKILYRNKLMPQEFYEANGFNRGD
ncbi:hypothetical protein PHYSODRAFT_288581 [Phytophthora sojae]|uniref:RxLR effector protein n=1 Tax=Phytophthora sojae (strain P6497) TaxID=1094619 RepID=G5A5Q2_PHYSP|nr:hypothetical protein PHYSODRAFT_288581 [Phytophthora sojae]EGZ08657.1 hypothetical protein PHYSODRAFT_288581 [Phytophthora sojae]|eukprot:XP_009535290.1 hypothetical protein PHYSODRAFT_288581 [Phytophthora sojae]